MAENYKYDFGHAYEFMRPENSFAWKNQKCFINSQGYEHSRHNCNSNMNSYT